MSEYTAVNEICRPRARSKNARIIGNRIVGTGEPEPEPVILDSVREKDGFVRLEIRIKPAIYDAFRRIAKTQGRSITATLARYLNRTGLFLLKKIGENGTVE
jgi:hypothetical protein